LEKINNLSCIRRTNSQLASKNSRAIIHSHTFCDVKPSTIQQEEISRFQRIIKEEVALRNIKIIPKKKLIKKEPFVLTQKNELALHHWKEKKQREADEKREALLLEITNRRKLRQKNRQKISLAMESTIAKLSLFSNATLFLISAPFRLLLGIFNKFRYFFNSFITSIDDFSRLLNHNRNGYYGYRKEKKHDWKNAFSFFAVATFVFLFVFGVGFFYHSLKIKNLSIENGKIAYASLNEAKEEIKRHNFDGALSNFNDAHDRFGTIQKDINSLGSVLVESSRFVPYLSKLSSGSHLSDAGKNISRIGILATNIMKTLDTTKNPLANNESVSYLKIFQDSDKNLTEIALQTGELMKNLEKINLADIPEEQRNHFIELKNNLPEINKFITNFSKEEKILADVLGGNGPRKYLFLFQNNQEMRATGGFIGTYAVLDIFDGNVKSFFVDGIFNPDGQLREKIIPPAPIQKISATWSLHDSNWFPDFPMSAEKASWFYEKTGGPTVDGVITMTPTVMQRLLEITGPIEMTEYGITIDSQNFLENIQYEVEVDYDKELNQPKKILADLAPKILNRVFNARNISDVAKTMNVILSSLNEKHILIYSKNYAVEKMLSENGWSGEVLDTDKDYLSVINTNINGYKTDGVIDEKIEHKAEIQNDGSIIDTVTIIRHHNGGDTPYDWWNKVNADYMRVYVPKGSRLIRATGYTNEFNSPPIDYNALGFKKDAQIGMEEDSLIIDPESGTKIYEDSNKTVFANWTYVSPQESVTISYSYLLPFKIHTNQTTKPADAYSLLIQKQSGSLGSKFSTKITYPNSYRPIWKYPNENVSTFSNTEQNNSGIEMKSELKTDKFIGVAFEKNNP
jgi:hypothetical protein